MSHYKIAFVDHLAEDIEEKMRNDPVAYEGNHGIDVNYKRFSVVMNNEAGDAFGGINAFTAFAEIYIDDIWVETAHRGKGYGRKLLQAVEDHFKGKGFNNINLVTSAFSRVR